jgi:hypothetical protein
MLVWDVLGGGGRQHTSFRVSIAGNELSKPFMSSSARLALPEVAAGWLGPEKSPPPSRSSSSPSSTCADFEGGASLAEKRSASSPSAARSRSRKLPPVGSGRISASPVVHVSALVLYCAGTVGET